VAHKVLTAQDNQLSAQRLRLFEDMRIAQQPVVDGDRRTNMDMSEINKGSCRTTVPSAWKAKRHLGAVLVMMSLSAAACSSAADDARTTTNPASTIDTEASTTGIPANTDAPTTTARTVVESDGSQIPSPDGPFVVGVSEVPLANTVAYFPAVVGTGAGHRPYLGPETANILGVAPDLFDAISSSAIIDATPLPAPSPRPVVILTAGFASPIELSTSLAEQLASHGYIVIAAQTDLAAESAFGESDAFDQTFHTPRTEQLTRLLDLLDNPALPGLVGAIDRSRIAVGGHSYAGWIAFDTSLTDTRITAVFNLDGFGGQNQAFATVPALVIASHDGIALDPKLVALSPKLVAVVLLNAGHFDLTDAPSIATTLGDVASTLDLGTIGPVATSNTSTVVLRFLDSTLATSPRLPTPTELIKGWASPRWPDGWL
jgi:dienelactone hydrolase